VRIPWVLLFMISVSGACQQYEQYGYVTPNMAFMVLATGLYLNACAKGEECIPQTWDMFHEKWGFMVIFWNFAGVPFTYCYSIVYMAAHPPEYYRFSTPTYVFMYALLLFAHFVFDSSMAQKSRFRMQLQGTLKVDAGVFVGRNRRNSLRHSLLLLCLLPRRAYAPLQPRL